MLLIHILTNPTALILSVIKLLLEGGGSAFFILTSWITIHIPEVSLAYCTYDNQLASIGLTPRTCLLGLAHNLLNLALKLFEPRNRVSFKFGGQHGIRMRRELLLKRCLDTVWICLINIQAGYLEFQSLIQKLKQVCGSETAVV